MRLLKGEYLVVGFFATVIVSFSLLFYFDITKKIKTGDLEVVGAITFKRKTAQRKYTSHVVWEDIKQESPVYNFDSIRTAGLSEAVLKLKDGTEIALDENSMIVIALSEDEVDVNFSRGSIKANRNNVEGSSLKKLNIDSMGTKISIDKSDISLTQQKGEKISLTVNKGTAEIKSGDKEQVIQQNQKIIASPEEIRVYKLNLTLIRPEARKYFITTNDTKKIQFSWKTIKNIYNIFLEISLNKFFDDIIVKSKVSKNSILLPIKKGNYYWRLKAVNKENKKIEFSEIRRFSIIKDEPIHIIAPQHDKKIFYRKTLPVVSFKWEPSEMVSSYKVLISQDPEMSKITNSTQINNNGLVLDNLTEGVYYWKVEKVSSIADIALSGSSNINKLMVIRREKIQPPELIYPPANKEINKIVLQKKNIIFTWRKNPEIKISIIEISRNNEFNEILHKSESQTNYYKFTDNLSTGKYFWRVTGELQDNVKTGYSPIRSFKIIESKNISLIKPENNTVIIPDDTQKHASIDFIWKKTNIDGKYILQVSKDKSFTKIFEELTSAESYQKITKFNPGQYYWRVNFKYEADIEPMKSNPRSFIVLKKLGLPEIISPARNSTVDMKDINQITFKWKGLKNANLYKFSLYQEKAGTLHWVLAKETTSPQCVIDELKKLDIGKFQWSVQAIETDKIGKRILRKSKKSKGNFNIILGKNDKKLKIKSPTIIYIE